MSLHELAHRHGVATSYTAWDGEHRQVSDEAIVTVAASIRHKAGLPDDGDDWGFLSDYYAALCARLERDSMLGHRRENKFAAAR